MVNLGVLASGRGSNFQSIIDSIASGHIKARIQILITDNPQAYAIERAEKSGIPCLVMKLSDYSGQDEYYENIAKELKSRKVDLVILAGFMRVVKRPLIEAFPMKIMNIHPALLPSFPGLHGQQQAVDYGVKISGCTVHFVDEGVDTGPVIIQVAVPVNDHDTEDSLSDRILKYEHKIFPYAIKLFAEGRIRVDGRTVKVEKKEPVDDVIVNPPIDF
jgi:phosphoribosylglycinamide formyltransferase-1